MEEDLFAALYPKFIILLVILATAEAMLLCPNGCKCAGDVPGNSLTVDCQRNPDVDRAQLSKQIDLLLSSDVTYGLEVCTGRAARRPGPARPVQAGLGLSLIHI